MKDYVIRKIKGKKGKEYIHEYTDKRGKSLSKKEYGDLLKDLYIAPAYDNVKINKNKNDKVLAIGTDDKGRKQYTYNPDYIQKATDNKYKKLIEFGNNYKCIMRRVTKDMNTLLNEHIKVTKDGITLDFIGKEGVRNKCSVHNAKLARNLRTKKKTLHKKDRIFSYRTNNRYHNVSASDVNNYLKQFGDFSAKNFRTWSANTDLVKELKKLTTNLKKTSLKKHLNESVKKVAKKMHHTASICKKNYINKELMDLYVDNNDKFRYYFRSTDKEGISEDLIKFMKSVYR